MKHQIQWKKIPGGISEEGQYTILQSFSGMLDIYLRYKNTLMREYLTVIERCKEIDGKDYDSMKASEPGKRILELEHIIQGPLKEEFRKFDRLFYQIINVKTMGPSGYLIMHFIGNQRDVMYRSQSLSSLAENFTFKEGYSFLLNKKGFFDRWLEDMKFVIDALHKDLQIYYDLGS
ncbi:MAG: hypothetical protein HGA85_08565 [Nanoarchaeota archaeon]|nr:hypothetical protein [Nanoarchaeota archaeon]